MQEYLVTLLGGLVTTLELTLFSLLLGIALAALMTWVLELRLPVATQLVQLWVLIFTGTPLLIQIFLIYYGPGQFEWLKASPLWPLLKQPWFCAVLALGLNTAAYPTRLFKGALDAIPAGEVEACRALGFSSGQTLWMKVRHAARTSRLEKCLELSTLWCKYLKFVLLRSVQIRAGLVELRVINRTNLSEHRPLSGNIKMPWKSEELEGVVEVHLSHTIKTLQTLHQNTHLTSHQAVC